MRSNLLCAGLLYGKDPLSQLMAIHTTYTNARANFARLCDEVTKNQEVVAISRRGGEDVALISAEELASLAETAHLLRSPKNAERLLRALDRARARTERPQGIDEFREEVGLGKKA
jgi:antitoxin YefM